MRRCPAAGCLSGRPPSDYRRLELITDTAVLYQSSPVCEGYELSSISQPELAAEPIDVGANGRGADEQLGGDLLDRQTSGEERQDLAFACGERVEHRAERCLDLWFLLQEPVDQPGRDLRSEHGLAVRGRTHRRAELFTRHLLHEKAADARVQHRADGVLVLLHG